MALFSRNKEEKTEEKKDVSVGGKAPASTAGTPLPTDRDLSGIIIKPRITEKAVKKGEQNVYTFLVHKDATKFDVRDAVKELFKVTPVKINIVNKSPRQYLSRSRSRRVTERGQKKAYVYLKAGDSIELA